MSRPLLASFVAAAALVACSGIRSQTNSFATLAEAREAGAISSGSIPEGLPPSAHDIREGHVPGTRQRWGLFEYPHAEEPALRDLLQPDEMRGDSGRCEVPPRIEWWPVMLRGQVDAGRLATTGVRVYRAKQGDLLYAVNWSQGRAYYWSPANE
jgi:hypothetical protein